MKWIFSCFWNSGTQIERVDEIDLDRFSRLSCHNTLFKVTVRSILDLCIILFLRYNVFFFFFSFLWVIWRIHLFGYQYIRLYLFYRVHVDYSDPSIVNNAMNIIIYLYMLCFIEKENVCNSIKFYFSWLHLGLYAIFVSKSISNYILAQF